jgi:ATPase subunit of ABC transporter with duplicated ATPase domains
VKVGVFSQHSVDQLNIDTNAVDYLRNKCTNLKHEEARKILGTVGLPGNIHMHPLNTLSGGQKARVVLAELIMTPCHLLLLDEITNHLDLETIESLIEGLQNFKGGILIVSHHTELISSVCETLYVCKNQKVSQFNGTFENYCDSLVV